MKNIIFTGGGTGGHIMPNLAIIEKLQGYNIYYLGTNGIEKEIISKYKDINFIEIPAVKFVRKLTLKNALIPMKLYKSIVLCKDIIKKINPVLIFSKGGFVSVPVCLAGKSLHIPIITHESDLTLGLANKIIARKANFLCCSFEETAKRYGKNAIHSGSPIREKIFEGKKNIIINRHKIENNKPIITIVGGSLGASKINTSIRNNIDTLTKKYNIIHLTGKNKIDNNLLNHKDYYQIEFSNDIENYFDASDMIISRAGSNTIFELLALHKPMLLIPLPKEESRGDQILNAENFYKNNLANILYQNELSSENLLNKIDETIRKKDFYTRYMSNYKMANGNDFIIDLISRTEKNKN